MSRLGISSNILRLVGAGWTGSIGYQDASCKSIIHTGYEVVLQQGVRGEFDYFMTESGRILGPVRIAKIKHSPEKMGNILTSALLGNPLPYFTQHDIQHTILLMLKNIKRTTYLKNKTGKIKIQCF